MRFKLLFLLNLVYKVVTIQAEILAYQTQGGSKQGAFESEFLAFEPKPTSSLYGVSLTCRFDFLILIAYHMVIYILLRFSNVYFEIKIKI